MMTERLRNHLAFAMALCVAMCSSARSPSSLTLEQIIEHHTKAAGGRAAIESVRGIEMSLSIQEPTYQVDAIYRADRDRRMRIDVYANQQRVFTESYDGQRAWQLKGGASQAEDSSPKGTAALWHGIVLPGKLFGLHEVERLGHRLALDGREELDGVDYHVLKLTLSDRFETFLYLNPATWLIERTREVRALHPDMDPTESRTESRFSDFRSVDGVVRAHKDMQIDLRTGAVLSTATLTRVTTNPVLDPAMFQKPPQAASDPPSGPNR